MKNDGYTAVGSFVAEAACGVEQRRVDVATVAVG